MLVGKIYALDDRTRREKIINHDNHDIEKNNKVPYAFCLSPMKMRLAIVENCENESREYKPEIRGLGGSETKEKEQDQLDARVQPMNRCIALNIGKINEHSISLANS